MCRTYILIYIYTDTIQTATHFLTGRQFLCHPQKALHVAERVEETDGGDAVGSALKEDWYIKEWDKKCSRTHRPTEKNLHSPPKNYLVQSLL